MERKVLAQWVTPTTFTSADNGNVVLAQRPYADFTGRIICEFTWSKPVTQQSVDLYWRPFAGTSIWTSYISAAMMSGSNYWAVVLRNGILVPSGAGIAEGSFNSFQTELHKKVTPNTQMVRMGVNLQNDNDQFTIEFLTLYEETHD